MIGLLQLKYGLKSFVEVNAQQILTDSNRMALIIKPPSMLNPDRVKSITIEMSGSRAATVFYMKV